jgi:polyketide synthase PksN
VNEPNSKLSKANLIIVHENGKVLVKINESIGIPLTDIHEKPTENVESGIKAQENSIDEFSNLYYAHFWEQSSDLLESLIIITLLKS